VDCLDQTGRVERIGLARAGRAAADVGHTAVALGSTAATPLRTA
jgi:hypothetical protein